MTYRAAAAADLSEKQHMQMIRELATILGWNLIFHPLRSRGSTSGWPDLAMVRERLVLAELKTNAKASKLTVAQKTWLRALIAAGEETYVVRPRDFDDFAAVLQARDRVFSVHAFDARERLLERTRAEVDA